MQQPLKISKQGLELIRTYETFTSPVELSDYGQPMGGYGHVGKEFRIGDLGVKTVSREEAENLLLRDLVSVETALNALIEVQLNQNQFDALCSFTFSVGTLRFAASPVLKLINKGNFKVAAFEIEKSYTFKGKEPANLKQRRKAEAELLLKEMKPRSRSGTRTKVARSDRSITSLSGRRS